MELSQKHRKTATLIAVCCVLMVASTAIFPAQAADGTRVLTIALLATGMGLKFGSVFVESSAQESYNEYLSTAVQSEIRERRDDYASKHDLSVALSRTGMGLVGLAVIIAVFDELEIISKPSSGAQPALMRLTPGYHPRTHETVLLFQRQF